MNRYNSSRFQVESYFRKDNLSQSQIDELVKILGVLAKYMLVDRDILNTRSPDGKIGLSHIQRAINLDLIVEWKAGKATNSAFEVEGNHYFYTLGFAGINFLRVSGTKFQCFNITDTFESKEKVLIANYHMLDRDYELLFSDHNDQSYNFFHCENINRDDIILYFEEHISEDHIRSLMKRKFVSQLPEEKYESRHKLFDKFISKFTFETIDPVTTNYTNKLKGQYTIESNLLAKRRMDSELSGADNII